MTTKSQLNARVRITSGPASGLYGRVAHTDESTWKADIALDDGRTVRGIPMKLLELIAEEHVTDRQKLLDRIRKLHAKAESAKAIGNEAEALAFAGAVQKMLAKYRLSLDDLAMEELDRNEPIESEWNFDEPIKKRALWYESLAHVVARAHFVRVFFSTRGGAHLYLVGRATDRKIAAFVIHTLARTADELSDTAARKFRKAQRRSVGATTFENRNYRTAWLNGFVERIAERYREETANIEREQTASGGTSLVLVQRNALAQIDAHIQAHVQLSNRRSRSRGERRAGYSASQAGRRDGRDAANSVNIRGTGLGAGSPRSPKSIGGGN
jgi:hypothetical protein